MRGSLVLPLVLLGALTLSVPATAQERKASSGKEGRYSDRDRKADWEKGKQALERALKPGEGKDFYRRELEKLGYMVTSVNYDKPDYVEYEIVKGDNTYEVQIDFDKNHRANKIDVTSNIWKADATKQALEGKKVKTAKTDGRYSDRDRKSDWSKGKEELQRALKTGEDKAFYRKELEKLGYKVTSVNYDKPDYAEYEIVKGDQTYEVQIDLDKDTHKAKKVDVTTNMWQADATKRALEANKGKTTAARNSDKQEAKRQTSR